MSLPQRPSDYFERFLRRLRSLNAEASIAGAAFVLSLTTITTSAWVPLRGPEVIAVDPASIFLYRDAGQRSVLTAGVDSALVNSASANFGDVVTSISMEIIPEDGGPPPVFKYQALLTPVFTEQASERMSTCPITSRCVRNGQFLVLEEPRRTLDVPGGSSRSEYIGFVLNENYCSGSPVCSDFETFQGVASLLDQSPVLTIRFKYKLHRDGEKSATCRVRLWGDQTRWQKPWLAQHLAKTGWVALPCESRSKWRRFWSR